MQEDYLGQTSCSYSADFVYTETTDQTMMTCNAARYCMCVHYTVRRSRQTSVCAGWTDDGRVRGIMRKNSANYAQRF